MDLDELIDSRRDGWSLPGDFYRRADVYQAELDAIWRKQWLFAGHACQIPKPGDYFVQSMDGDSILIIRGDDAQLRAMHNICRHRGTRLCSESEGHTSRLVCPYHQWVYGSDGSLLACRGMQEDLDKSELGLVQLPIRTLQGMIYICLSDPPPDFEKAFDAMSPVSLPQGLPDAKIADSADYEVPANWKLVWENNRECYHCNANHPQYIRANFDHYNQDDTGDTVRAKLDAAVTHAETQWQSAGLALTHKETGMTCFPDPDRDIWYAANRTPLAQGYLSESMDGKPASSVLMGDYPDPDVGTLRMRTMPNMWIHGSCDHAVSTRLLPGGLDTTCVRVTWLVDKAAVEGRDYQLERLKPFWQLTSEQDWDICRAAQLGVTSSGYRPGPYSKYKEYNVDAFVRWYLKSLNGPASPVNPERR